MTVQIELDEDLVALLHDTDRPLRDAARELMVLELYRRRVISSGKAAALLEMPRLTFIKWSSGLGIPFFDMTEEEWAEDRASQESCRRP